MGVLGTKHSVKVCMLAVCVLIACLSNVYAATYYVDGQNGNDQNSGVATSTAWRTIGKANAAVWPGDTVYLRGGTYREVIRPNVSGVAGNSINYARYNGEEVVITDVVHGVDLRNRHYITVDGLKIVGVASYWVNMEGVTESDGSSHNIIRNCYMDRSPAWAGIYMKKANYNRISHCTLIGHSDGAFCGPDDLIFVYEDGSYNVIEDSFFEDAPHNAVEFQGRGPGVVHYNVVRNNSISNKFHTGMNVYTNSDYTLAEGNRVFDCGDVCEMDGCPGNLCGSDGDKTTKGLRDRQNGIQWGASGGIIRNNVLVNNGNALSMNSYTWDGSMSQHNRIYHNTFYENYHAVFTNSDGPMHSNVFKNNILSNQRQLEIRRTVSGTPNDNYYANNNILGASIRYDPDGTVSLDHLQSTYSSMWYDNLQRAAEFVDGAGRDLYLKSTSPMIDAGAFLTRTASSGSGTSIPVEDASYFYDGWGIPGEEGDLIQLEGQMHTARIVSIDYGNNRITVDSVLTYSVGQGVALPYQGSAPDIGALEFYPDATTYTLTGSATNGVITKTPDKTMYNAGESVVVEAIASAGYEFGGWSGDLAGTTNPVAITMNANKSIAASFTAVAPTTYTLNTGATNGTVTVQPEKSAYSQGETVTLTAIANQGYEFAGWSGDLTGTINPTVVTMNANKSVTASFTAVAPTTYTLNTSATNGTVTAQPEKAAYSQGETVTLAAAANQGYEFGGWSGDLAGTANPTVIIMNTNKSISASFTLKASDETPPAAVGVLPEAGAVQVPINSLVTVRIWDGGQGIAAETVTITVDGTTVYSGDVRRYDSSLGTCRRQGTEAEYVYSYNGSEKFERGETVTIRVNAADRNGNVMDEQAYSFETEMWAFGANKSVSSSSRDTATGPIVLGLDAQSRDVDMRRPATAQDSRGNIWVVWHEEVLDQRDIYVSKMVAGTGIFMNPLQVTADGADQCNPHIAIGPDDRLYVVWQENRRGNWDVYFSTSTDGTSWAAATAVADPEGDQTEPVIAVDDASLCHVAYQDDAAGNQDIYVARSDSAFATQTLFRVTSDASDQTDPAVAVDASGVVYLVWTDGRNGSEDIYGAASNEGPWNSIAVVTGPGNQNTPALATEDVGVVLHFAWANDVATHSDIYYTFSNGMPAGPLNGINVVDDTSAANQVAPAIRVTGSTGNDLRVFLCWQDWRNATTVGEDADLYFVEVREGDEVNILVGDDGTASDQSEPAVGVDLYGYPYVVWTDTRNASAEIYYAGATFANPEVVDAREVIASEGGTVGVTPPTDVDDISVVIPAGAASQDVTISIARIENPQAVLTPEVVSYEFGPSGLEFGEPVTITIPYAMDQFPDSGPEPCWYDALTDTLSRRGITNIEHVVISPTVGAMRFKTTHFTPYYLVSSESGLDGGGGTSGGGCSISFGADGTAVEFLLPYAGLACVMFTLRRHDRKARRAVGEDGLQSADERPVK